jgi:RHS repeat-associated protein
VATTAAKGIQTRYYYDAWGKQTLAAGTGITNRGYTGHEHLAEFGLINMNARLYDPVLGRFMAVDPYVQMPDYTQAYNRYSYVLNNPLRYTDPSGEFIFSLFLGPIGAVIDAACWSAAIDAVVQGIKIASGAQDKFNWAELGGAAIGGAVGGTLSAVAPAFTQSNLFVRYSTKALYAGLTGAASTGAGMLGQDLLDNGKIDYSGKDYLKGMALGGGISMGISLAGSAYDYKTWDRFSDAEKINILNNEFGNTVQLDNTLPYKSGYKFNAGMTQGDAMVSLRSDALATRSMARSLVSHELVHMSDFAAQSLAVRSGTATRNLNQFITYTEHNAYTAQLLSANKFNITGNLWLEARRFSSSLYGLNTHPNTFSIWQLMYNIW